VNRRPLLCRPAGRARLRPVLRPAKVAGNATDRAAGSARHNGD